MAELATVARPYAEATFDVAAAAGALPRWSDLLAEMAAVAANPDLQVALEDPRLTQVQRIDLFVSCLKTPLEGPERNFVAVLAENGRLGLLPEIAAQYEALRAEREGVADAEIESAFAMGDGDLAKLVATLERRFKRRIRPNVRVDAALIGGVRVAVGDEVIDASVRGKLDAMRTALQN
jgi:F-type H+-transporting ATPase subunit delta